MADILNQNEMERYFADEAIKSIDACLALARAFYDHQMFARAESTATAALSVALQVFASSDPRVAAVQHDIGNYQALQGKHAEAVEILKSALATRRIKLGTGSPESESTLSLITMSLHALGDSAWEKFLADQTVYADELED